MNYYAFIITTLAGLSTLFGSIIINVKTKNKNKIINNSLAFAAGIMITTSITDLIPNSYLLLSNIYKIFPRIIICLIGLNIGVIISMLINKYIPDENIYVNDKKLYRVGIFAMLAIIMHNIPEGIATYITTSNNMKLGITLSIAIALHNIPEGISIALPIYYATNNKLKAILYTAISGLSELLGAFVAQIILAPYINDKIMALLYLIIAGMMLYISLSDLIPISNKYNNNEINKKYIISGALIMIISHLLLN